MESLRPIQCFPFLTLLKKLHLLLSATLVVEGAIAELLQSLDVLACKLGHPLPIELQFFEALSHNVEAREPIRRPLKRNETRQSLSVLARRFSVSRDAIHRHRRNHMPPQLIAAILAAQHPSDIDLEALERSESEGLLASLVAQRARLQMLSEMAFEEGELHAATAIERAITSSLELTSKLLGMIVQRSHTTSTSVLISADYIYALQARVLRC
jgi:hypothetical protein